MKTLLACVGVCGFASNLTAVEQSIRGIPPEIKVAMPDQREARKLTVAFDPRKEVQKLFGPQQIIKGEMVAFRYGWSLTAFKRDDPTKIVNAAYLKANPFLFAGGDAYNRAELEIKTTGDIVVLTRPTRADAPAGALIELVNPSIIRMPKNIVQNRLCAPTDSGRTPDGKEFWHFEHSVTEVIRTFRTAQSTTLGTIGNEQFNATTTQKIPLTLSRTFTAWNFTLVFNNEDRVEQIVSGKTGPSEWKEVAGP